MEIYKLDISNIIFIVALCMLIVSSLLFVQLMHTNYCKIVKELKSFKILILAPTCFRLLKPSSGGALSLCFAKVTMLTSVTYRNFVTLAKHRLRAPPDDDLSKRKHVGANIKILNDFNSLTILQ